MKTNEEILLGVKRGDASDFELLYARYKEKLHNFILAVSNYDYYLTEEVVQITFVKIWETRERIDMDKSFGSYITTIARNTLITEKQNGPIAVSLLMNLFLPTRRKRPWSAVLLWNM